VGAFAVLPDDAPVGPSPGREHLRLADLHHGALTVLGRPRDLSAPLRRWPAAPSTPGTLRVMTYNVHGCVGMDGKVSTSRICRVIARHRPDVVALQELDVGRRRTGGVDQACAIANELEMKFHFHAALEMDEERYGNAVLSRHPMRLVRAEGLPRLSIRPGLEPRGALWIAIDVGGSELNLVTTHLGLSRRERVHHADVLLGPEWLGHPECRAPIVLCGDLNDGPRSTTWRRFHGLLRDAQLALDGRAPRRTWLGRLPLARIDHVFVSEGIRVLSVDVPRTELTRRASDHLPLVVEMAVPPMTDGSVAGPAPPRDR
jgi:endonuclease/exonuclease/phosphatase family metal-dependent hydrolase